MKISEIEELANQLKINANKTLDFNKYTWYSITHHSTFLEGSTLTESQVINLLEYGKTAKNKPFNHHVMVTDYYNALRHIISLSHEPPIITVNHLRQIGAMGQRAHSALDYELYTSGFWSAPWNCVQKRQNKIYHSPRSSKEN